MDNTGLTPVPVGGWRTGFGNLFRAECRRWWKTRLWWIQLLIWTAAINGLLFAVLSAPSDTGLPDAVLPYGVFGGFFTSVGVIIVMQGSMVGEKISGTAAWVLSKPVSRASFFLAKWLGNAIGFAVTAVLVPGVIAYGLFTVKAGMALEIFDFLAGLGILLLFNLFWLSLTLMLGAMFNRRGAVIAIPLALVLGQQFISAILMQISDRVAEFLPFALVMPDMLVENSSIVSAIILGAEIPTANPIVSSMAGVMIFTAIGIWKFNQEEL